MKAVTKGCAETVPYLEEVMFEGIDPQGHHLKPATLDVQMIGAWIVVDEKTACDTLCQQWGMARAPECAEEALSMLASEDCITKGLERHRLTSPGAMWELDDGEWAVGHCRDCVRFLL